MGLAVRRLVRLSALVAPLAFSGSVLAQNFIVGNEVTLSPFATGSSVVSPTPVKLSSIANDQQGPGSPIGIRQANGEADNTTGVLRASAGFIGVCCGFSPSALGRSAIGGIVKIVGPGPVGSVESATFSFDFHGVFDPNGFHETDSLNGFLQVLRVVDAVNVPFWTPPYGLLRPSLTFQGDATSATSFANTGGNPSYEQAVVLDSTPSNLHGQIFFTIPVVVGESFRVTAQLSAASALIPTFTDAAGSLGAVAAMNTGVLSITLPDGFSIESPDGLLSAVGPVVPTVPEPSTNALLLAGIGLVAWRARRSTRA